MGNDFFQGPPALQQVANGAWNQPKPARPVGYAHGFATACQHSVTTLVAILLGTGGPAAVAGFVIAVVLGEAVDAMPGRGPWPQIGQEVFKPVRPQPAGADFDATAAVVGVSPIVGVGATTFHVRPDAVLWLAPPPMCSVVAAFPAKTTATLGFARLQGGSMNLDDLPAVAFAPPKGSLAADACQNGDDEAAEPLASQVLKTDAPAVLQAAAAFGVASPQAWATDSQRVAAITLAAPGNLAAKITVTAGNDQAPESSAGQVDELAGGYNRLCHDPLSPNRQGLWWGRRALARLTARLYSTPTRQQNGGRYGHK